MRSPCHSTDVIVCVHVTVRAYNLLGIGGRLSNGTTGFNNHTYTHTHIHSHMHAQTHTRISTTTSSVIHLYRTPADPEDNTSSKREAPQSFIPTLVHQEQRRHNRQSTPLRDCTEGTLQSLFINITVFFTPDNPGTV